MNVLAKAMGVPAARIMSLLSEIALANELEGKTDHEIPVCNNGTHNVYIQIGNKCEISFCGDNCTFNQYNIDRMGFEKLHSVFTGKNKKMKRGKR